MKGGDGKDRTDRVFPNPDAAFFTITTVGFRWLVSAMGRRSTDSAAQTKTKTKAPSSGSSKTSKPGSASLSAYIETPKTPSMRSKKQRTVGPDEEEEGGPSAVPPTKKKATIASTTTKKSVDDKSKPSISKKDLQSRSKPVKSPPTVANTGGNFGPKAARKKQKVAPEPVEADSEESEQEWVGFGGADEGSGEEEDEEDEDGNMKGGDDDSSEEELLHGLSSDDQDSSDEEVELPGIDVSKLPTIAKDDKTVKQKLDKAKRKPVCIA